MAPIATTETSVVDTTDYIGQLKLNAAASSSTSHKAAQKKESVRVVDPFNYVVSPLRHLFDPRMFANQAGRDLWRHRIIRVCRLPS